MITGSAVVSIGMQFTDTAVSTTEGSLICIEGRKDVASGGSNLGGGEGGGSDIERGRGVGRVLGRGGGGRLLGRVRVGGRGGASEGRGDIGNGGGEGHSGFSSSESFMLLIVSLSGLSAFRMRACTSDCRITTLF